MKTDDVLNRLSVAILGYDSVRDLPGSWVWGFDVTPFIVRRMFESEDEVRCALQGFGGELDRLDALVHLFSQDRMMVSYLTGDYHIFPVNYGREHTFSYLELIVLSPDKKRGLRVVSKLFDETIAEDFDEEGGGYPSADELSEEIVVKFIEPRLLEAIAIS